MTPELKNILLHTVCPRTTDEASRVNLWAAAHPSLQAAFMEASGTVHKIVDASGTVHKMPIGPWPEDYDFSTLAYDFWVWLQFERVAVRLQDDYGVWERQASYFARLHPELAARMTLDGVPLNKLISREPTGDSSSQSSVQGATDGSPPTISELNPS